MTPSPESQQFIKNYLKAYGFGFASPNSTVRSPIEKTESPVKDYILAHNYGLPKKPEV